MGFDTVVCRSAFRLFSLVNARVHGAAPGSRTKHTPCITTFVIIKYNTSSQESTVWDTARNLPATPNASGRFTRSRSAGLTPVFFSPDVIGPGSGRSRFAESPSAGSWFSTETLTLVLAPVPRSTLTGVWPVVVNNCPVLKKTKNDTIEKISFISVKRYVVVICIKQ